MSILLDDRFVAVTKLQNKHVWLTKSGRPLITVTPRNIERVNDTILGDPQMAADELCRIFPLSKSDVMTITHETLGHMALLKEGSKLRE
ncbi:hypothetical protein Trydic_g14821 [Trypoxylus dichotomus]